MVPLHIFHNFGQFFEEIGTIRGTIQKNPLISTHFEQKNG